MDEVKLFFSNAAMSNTNIQCQVLEKRKGREEKFGGCVCVCVCVCVGGGGG